MKASYVDPISLERAQELKWIAILIFTPLTPLLLFKEHLFDLVRFLDDIVQINLPLKHHCFREVLGFFLFELLL